MSGEELQQCRARQLFNFQRVARRLEIWLYSGGFLRAHPDEFVVSEDGRRRVAGVLLDVVGLAAGMCTPRHVRVHVVPHAGNPGAWVHSIARAARRTAGA